jgi:hypothetical protein
MFAVLIGVANDEGLLRPGMNVDAEFDVAEREAVLTVPLMALRAARDVEATAEILGVDAGELRRQLALPEDAGRRPRAGEGASALRAGSGLWVVAERDGGRVPVPVETGITDLDRVEIVAGLAEGERVLLLPTASLVEIQQQVQNFVRSRAGIPGLTQRPATQPSGTPPAPPAPRQR